MRVRVVVAVAPTLPSGLVQVIQRRGRQVLQLCVVFILFNGRVHLFVAYRNEVTCRIRLILVPIRFNGVGTLFVQTPNGVHRVLFLQWSNFRPSNFSNHRIMSASYRLVTFRPDRQVFIQFNFHTANDGISGQVVHRRTFVRPMGDRHQAVQEPGDPFVSARLILVGKLPTGGAFDHFIHRSASDIVQQGSFRIILLHGDRVAVNQAGIRILPKAVRVVRTCGPIFRGVMVRAVILNVGDGRQLVFMEGQRRKRATGQLHANRHGHFIRLLTDGNSFRHLYQFSARRTIALSVRVYISAPLRLFRITERGAALHLSAKGRIVRDGLFILSRRQRQVCGYRDAWCAWGVGPRGRPFLFF